MCVTDIHSYISEMSARMFVEAIQAIVVFNGFMIDRKSNFTEQWEPVNKISLSLIIAMDGGTF